MPGLVEDHCHRYVGGPAFGLVRACTNAGSHSVMTRNVVEGMKPRLTLDACCATYHQFQKCGIRVVAA